MAQSFLILLIISAGSGGTGSSQRKQPQDELQQVSVEALCSGVIGL